ncbi:hypothetical protein V499_05742 [Pseudogymnoascus sp. VKM F-103]|nr:hypothetical protein V499_05742 [Pseudogymnoascus sp. VKM F-103]
MMDTTTSWESSDPTLSAASQDDFQFLDLGINGMGDEVGFNFQDYAPQQQQNQQQQQQQQPQQQQQQQQQQHAQIMRQRGVDAMGSAMGNEAAMMDLQKHGMMQNHMPITTSAAMSAMTQPSPVITQNAAAPDSSLVEIDAQIQYLQLQRQQQQQRIVQEQHQNYYVPHNNRGVPPTPNSIEMHSGERQLYQQQHDPQQQAMFDSYQMRLREQELAFTPLVSPAVTPLETHFSLPEYTIPGAYFSPLSSPALHAHTEYSSMYSRAEVSASSPSDMNIDLLPPPANSTGGPGRKHSIGAGRKPAKPRAPRAVRQSPVVKAQRRKMTSTSISAETLSELVEPALAAKRSSTNSPSQPQPRDSSSENNSISPEHLSDMAPPPLPSSNSVRKSPYLTAQNSHPRVQQIISGTAAMSPATPASLMRIPRNKETMASPSLSVHAEQDDDQLMEDFVLPEAANPHAEPPKVATLENNVAAAASLPTPGSRTPSFKPLNDRDTSSSTSTITNNNPTPSPQIKPQPPTPNPTSTPSLRKTPKLAARGSAPRPPSVHASPALLPRISPSLKPMTRGPSISDDTASLLLATKSNYQNILEGTHLPGVSYPTELSTNLTSKRTSHKIAEQGRRNRINSALQEIATLLPGSAAAGSGSGDAENGDGGEGGGGKNQQQSSSSKASTVEHAIEYIKALRGEVEEATRRAERAEKALAEQQGAAGAMET